MTSFPVLLLVALGHGAPPEAAPPDGPPLTPTRPLSAEDSLRTFSIAPGYRVEVAASEPDVVDPVDMAFDARERLWVVEMGDYPTGAEEGKEPRGRVKVLSRRPDGRYRIDALFADGLAFPTGIAPWRGGVLVTTAKEVLFLEDRDGDGRADPPRILATDLGGRNAQLLPNNPTWAVDGGFYIANGLRTSAVTVPAGSDPREIGVRGRDFRLDPFTGVIEPVSGLSQFGLAFDDAGERFNSSNRNHLRHVVLEARYLANRPVYAPGEVVEDVSAGGVPAKVHPLSRNWTTSNLHAGTFTAACGLHIYRGDLLPELSGQAFVCEPTGNLVHRERLERSGATFTGVVIDEGAEFLRSPDEWFRPVNLTTGPDGALWIADMYRAVIEHPEFMPPELRRLPHLRAGDDRGRLYRIVPGDDEPAESGGTVGGPDGEARRSAARSPLLLEGASLDALLAVLDSPNAWRAETAQRLLLERRPQGAAGALRDKLSREGSPPAGRLRALWTLAKLEALDASLLLRALADDAPSLRAAALRLSEPFLGDESALRCRAAALAGDPDASVRFQCALTIARLAPADRLAPLRRLALRDGDDPWFRRAVALSSRSIADRLALSLLDTPRAKEDAPARLALVEDLAGLVPADDAATDFFRALVRREEEVPGSVLRRALRGLAAGCRREGQPLRARLAERKDTGDPRRLLDDLDRLITESSTAALDGSLGISERLDALALVSEAPRDIAAGSLSRVLLDEPEPRLRREAARLLLRVAPRDTPRRLLAGWSSYAPALRRQVIAGLLRRKAWAGDLLDLIASGDLPPEAIEPAERRKLLEFPDASIRERAKELLPEREVARRGEVIERYREALGLLDSAADTARGRALFEEHCASCHRVAGIGTDVGPDISDTRTKTAESLLEAILDPGAGVDGSYVSYVVITEEGEVHTGIIASETAATLTLRVAGDQSVTVRRKDIVSLTSTGSSLMPDGLEESLSVEDIADLIKFLKDWRYDDRD